METQMIINTLLSIVIFFCGWCMKIIWDSLKDLKKSDTELADKVQKIEVLVAGDYVKKHDFDRLSEALFKKLDKIEDKIDDKQDKLK